VLWIWKSRNGVSQTPNLCKPPKATNFGHNGVVWHCILSSLHNKTQFGESKWSTKPWCIVFVPLEMFTTQQWKPENNEVPLDSFANIWFWQSTIDCFLLLRLTININYNFQSTSLLFIPTSIATKNAWSCGTMKSTINLNLTRYCNQLRAKQRREYQYHNTGYYINGCICKSLYQYHCMH
jgi:hypothetical protein